MKRRDFLKLSAGCGFMGSTTLFNTLGSLKAVNGLLQPTSIAPPPTDYKALVCILLAGGIDSFNMLIPRGTTTSGDNGFNEYKAIRTDLAFQNLTDFLPLTNPQCVGVRGQNCAYGSFGVHPGLAELQQLFNNGKLAFMSNIGTLVEPIANETEFDSGLKKIPLEIYSHSDQIMQWQTSVPQSRDAVGVGGRLADLLHASNTYQEISMNISLAGKNVFQQGQNIAEYSIRNDINASNVGFTPVPSWWGSSGLINTLRSSTIDSLVSETYSNLLHQTYSSTAKSSIEAFGVFKEALQYVPSLSTAFPTTTLGKDLAAVARLLSVRNQLGTKRQIFFVTLGGWDMHDDLIGGLSRGLPAVSQAMKAFYDATVELGIADKVTTFTISDFARTITSNGLGSDHAWGGNSIVMGGAVNGGKIYGAYPSMAIDSNPKNISFRGNFIPAVSTDEFYAELALWYGVSPYDLCYVLPNLGNFYSYSPENYPVGFMNFSGTTISNDDLPQNCLTY